ncbi:hypothetical protein GCM10010191_41940 [Actinomadura vinacea]|uniref:PucR C-terminal helix-turn-helix domain-containing protein n=1 Tax=Actinomadura vinacea TaxID=115336 RepID=A0ABN3JCD6_9ACTN
MGALGDQADAKGRPRDRTPDRSRPPADIGDVDSYALLLASVPEQTRWSFRTRLLGPLEEYDSVRQAELLHTLEVFLSCSGSWNRTATRLHVHVNTLRYRIRRIEELTGRDLGTLEDRVDFFLALRAMRR